MTNQTISSGTTTELIIKKSKFIGIILPVQNEAEISNKLQEIKNKYSDATHICYAYILENSLQKAFDDNEPQGTAGLPILNVLKKKGLTNVLAVVIRYFGGVKLGAGGLTRAYSNATSSTILGATIIKNEVVEEYAFIITYGELTILEKLEKVSHYSILKKEYKENVMIFIEAPQGQKETLKKDLNDIFNRNITLIFIKTNLKEQK